MIYKIYIQVILIFIGYNEVSSEFQIFRLEDTFSSCHVKFGSLLPVDNGGNFDLESKEMCDLKQKENSCVFVAKHKNENDKITEDYLDSRCGECPFKSNVICNLDRQGEEGFKTICCCKSPNCLVNIYRDAEIGWKGIDSGSLCVVANYDSLREQRWIENHRIDNRNLLKKECFLTIRSSTFKDSYNRRNRSRLMMEMGHGCPFRMNSEKTQISTDDDRIHHCCQGPLCNQELFRVIGFEWIQNTVMMDEEGEFFRRLRFEKDYYRYITFARNTKYLHPKRLFDTFRANLVFLTILVSILIVYYCSPKNVEDRKRVKHRPKKKKNKDDIQSDEALMFGEM